MQFEMSESAAKFFAKLRKQNIIDEPREFVESINKEWVEKYWCCKFVDVYFDKLGSLIEEIKYVDRNNQMWHLVVRPYGWSHSPIRE